MFDDDIEMGLIETDNPKTNKQYELISPLGKGAMGAVYRGREVRTKKEVAIKIISLEEGETKERWKKRYKRGHQEAQGLIRLTNDGHSSFPIIYDVLQDIEGRLCIVMECVEGHELTELIKSYKVQKGKGRIRGSLIPKEELYSIAQQLFQMVRVLKGLNIVHRDIKPSNIMWAKDANGSIKLKMIDLGIAKMPQSEGAERVTQELEALGTLAYMSPEHLNKPEGGIDNRADLYSIGCVLYEMVTGEMTLTFEGNAVGQWCVQAALALAMPFPPERYPSALVDGMNPSLEKLLLGLLERDRDTRIQSAGEAEDRLMEALAKEKTIPPSLERGMIKTPITSAPPPQPKLDDVTSSRAVAIAILSITVGIAIVIACMLVWRGQFMNASASSAAPSASATPIPLTTLSPSTPTPKPSVSSTVKVERVVAMTRRELPPGDLLAFVRVENAVKATKTPCPLRTETGLVAISKKHPTFPDPMYWIAECNRRVHDKMEENWLRRYETLRGSRDPPLP